jgi:hypothetical protein
MLKKKKKKHALGVSEQILQLKNNLKQECLLEEPLRLRTLSKLSKSPKSFTRAFRNILSEITVNHQLSTW